MGKARILVVEDQNIIALDLKGRLTTLGYLVPAIVAYGEEAVVKAGEVKPDLVLMDIVLKGEMDGVQAAEQIHQQFGLPVIYLTAHSDERTLQRARLTEPYGYILKPFEDRELNMAIEIALYKHLMERKLRESERWLTATLKSIGDAVIAADTDKRIKFMNPAAEALTGWPQAEAAGRELSQVFKIVNEGTGARASTSVTKALREGTAVGPSASVTLATRDGREVPIEESASPIHDEQGNITGVVLIFRDITERKQAEVQLRESEEKYRALIERMNEGLLQVDNDDVIQFVNPCFCEMVGYSRDELLGQRAAGLFLSGETERAFIGEKNRLRAQAIADQYEIQIRKKNGDDIWLMVSGAPNVNAQGAVVGSIGIHTDITERKRAEQALAAANADLERALLNANELAMAAQAANRAKSEFLTNMSHEIRTPLTTVLGLTELTLASELAAEQHEWLEQVYTSSQVLLELINSILDLSKIEAARLELEQVEFELPALIQHVTATLASRAAAKQLDFHYSLNADTPSVVVGDPVRLRQVLLNLLDNAIKFTEYGEVSLRTRVERRIADEVTLHFTVSDTGVGIPEDKLLLIFEPFTQADGDIARRYGGTGLGLTISQRLVEKFCGSLWVESQVGRGSAFHFTACFTLPAQPATSEGDNGGSVQAASTVAFNILLAEDNPANQIVLRKMLEKRGWAVTVAGNGKAALEQYAGTAFDLILMDLQMPDMDGLSATKAIRAHEQGAGRRIPIVALTAFAMRGDRERCLQAGMDDYLAKPVKASELYSVVERLTLPAPVR